MVESSEVEDELLLHAKCKGLSPSTRQLSEALPSRLTVSRERVSRNRGPAIKEKMLLKIKKGKHKSNNI